MNFGKENVPKRPTKSSSSVSNINQRSILALFSNKFLLIGQFVLAVFLLFSCSPSCVIVEAEVLWTPIYVDTTNQLDLWTVKERGCECPDDKSSRDCACCVRPGGCLCTANHNRCAQCGLEDACQRFCNVSISSWNIAAKSGLSWVQLKSPSLQGPTSCWWRLESAPGQRIEVQIHRLMSVGSFDNSTQKCTKGYVQFAEGDVISPNPQAIQLCAENSRFSPPVVVFADKGIATLLLRIVGKTTRSQLLAYVSFSSADDPVVGDLAKGGRPKPHSVCDWIYDNCWSQECVLASPGYPGLSAPHRKCRYLLSGNSTSTRIRIIFHSLSFPKPQLCSTHQLAIWKNISSGFNNNLGAPWKVLCEESESVIDLDGNGVALLEFRSGSTTAPFMHNGFRATVQFIQMPAPNREERLEYFLERSRLATTTTSTRRPSPFTMATSTSTLPTPRRKFDDTETPLGNQRNTFAETEGVYPYPITCGHIFEGGLTRGTVFRLLIPKELSIQILRGGSSDDIMSFGNYQQSSQQKKATAGPFKCQIEFRGRAADIVQFAAFNYKFRGSNCSTTMEIYDMASERSSNHSDRLLGKLCGPAGNEVRRFTSSHSRMALVAFIFLHDESVGPEFLEGAFRFHDESVEGTVKPMSSCEVVYYGVTSAPSGSIVGPPDSPLLRLSTFPLVCAHSFLPGTNQTITLLLNRAGHESTAIALPNSLNYCRTICASSGCHCESKYTPLDQIDHLLLLSGAAAAPIACMCGYFKELLPLAFESHAPLTLVYHATKGGREFSYSVGFQFKSKNTCSNFTIHPPSSSKRWKEILGPTVQYNNRFNGHFHYTYFHCIWSVLIPPRFKLVLNFLSEENEDDCRAWNLTVWAGNNLALDPTPDDLLYSFCPKQGRKEFPIPDSIQHAFIKLIGVTIRPPQFEVRWKYIDVMLGSGFLTERKVANEAESNVVFSLNVNLLTSLLLILFVAHNVLFSIPS